ncbi:MAG: DUF2339 domain-containing protein [Thermoleophilaceae bacterium]
MDWRGVTGEHATRLDRLDDEVRELRARVALLEGLPFAQPSGARVPRGASERQPRVPQEPQPRGAREPQPRVPREPVHRGPDRPRRSPVPAPERTAPAQPRRDLEELLGGRVLGFAGGVAVLLGIAFLVAMAVNRGWLDEQARVALGFAGSALLLAAGVWLHERRGHTQASRAAAAAAIAGMFATLVAATRLYHLLALPASLAIAVLAGVVATQLAIRWRSRTIAALGLVGSLLAPILVGADMSGPTVVFTLVALAAAAAVTVWQRWGGLALASFGAGFLEIGAWVTDAASPAVLALVLACAWTLGIAAALGLALRSENDDADPFAQVLLVTNVLFAVAAGYLGLDELGHHTTASLWVAAIGVGQLGAGVLARRASALSRDLSILSFAAAVVAADLALAALADGALVTIGLAAGAVVLALTARLSGAARGREAAAASTGVVVQLGLAVTHVLAVDAQPATVAASGAPIVGSAAALALLTIALGACARLVPAERGAGVAFDALALAAGAYLTAYVLDGSGLAAALALEAMLLVIVARAVRVPHAAIGAAALVALAAGHAVAFEAIPRALVYGVPDLGAAAIALVAIAAAAGVAARLAPPSARELRIGLGALAGVALVYLGSVAIVTGFQPTADALGADTGLLSVRQQGQLVLSAFWSIAGVAALVAGLRRHQAHVRWAGFVLLGLATAKVFLFDLSALESLYRVGSFVGLGLLLLGGAFAYQRLRGVNGNGGEVLG